MFNDFLKVNQAEGRCSEPDKTQRTRRAKALDIAVIGIDCRIGAAESLDEFWRRIQLGQDFITSFPPARTVDTGPDGAGPEAFYPAAFLSHIDQFDHEFFNLSYNEACGMDPNQRLLLQSAWRAFEDAGYGRDALVGKNVGIFVGFNSDFDPTYREYVAKVAPDSLEDLSAPGNIQSVIASRLAYLLDLKGPSLVVDTACSSGLTALHLACQSLVRKESGIALLGGVKVRLLPFATENELGLRSESGRCKTFDERADGIGSGEGVVSFILKPLADAENDGDQIYAVVKATGVNQDGRSVGITAPNADAQHQLIRDVLQSGDINPETIALYEAHGTGTKLGDPVEVSAIRKAYQRLTQKAQYCAVGSVKSNVGHLDHAAALAGMAKVVMALKDKKLPATQHFHSPNSQIDFINSPLYVNETLKHWPALDVPRRAALSAFGLSGTNAHAIFEEYRAPQVESRSEADAYWIPLSAVSLAALERVIADLVAFLSRPAQHIALGDLAFTLACGRSHHPHRVVLQVQDIADLIRQLQQLESASLSDSPHYGFHKVVPPGKADKQDGERTDAELRQLTEALQALEMPGRLSSKAATYYLQGATVDWARFYANGRHQRLSLPTYPFATTRCWVPVPTVARVQGTQLVHHPLIDCLLAASYDRAIFATRFDVEKHWVLNEHVIDGNYIIPGTTYLEVASHLATTYLGYDGVQLQNVLFFQPVIVAPQQARDIQFVLIHEETHVRFVVVGQQGDSWNTYAQAEIHRAPQDLPAIDIPRGDALRDFDTVTEAQINQMDVSDVGPRWNSLIQARRLQSQVIGEFALADRFSAEVANYQLHPALLDHCVNIANGLAGQETYLPFSYRSVRVFRPLPARFTAWLTMKKGQDPSPQTVKYDIDVVDPEGRAVVAIRDYVIKQYKQNFRAVLSDGFETLLEMSSPAVQQAPKGEHIVLLGSPDHPTGQALAKALAQDNQLQCLASLTEVQDIHASLLDAERLVVCLGHARHEALAETLEQTALTLFQCAKTLVLNHRKKPLQITLIAEGGFALADEAPIYPAAHALYAMAKVVYQELQHVSVTCIDWSAEVRADAVLPLLVQRDGFRQLVLRKQGCFSPVLHKRAPQGREAKPAFRADGVYLITGASGALAQQAALLMASQPVGHVCLLSRTEPQGNSPKSQRLAKLIAQLQSAGVSASHHQLDVADQVAMANALAQIRQQFGAIRGVIHTAGLAGDGFMFRKDEDEFRQVIQAKVLGAGVLDALTREDPLDFFVLYSSVTAVFAGMGQSDYTFANAWLDGLAARRRQQGLPALSIQWPAWSEIGMAVDKNAKLDGLVEALTTREGIQILEHLLSHQAQGVVMPGRLNAAYTSEEILPVTLGFPLHVARAGRPDLDDEAVVLKGGADGSTDDIDQFVATVWASVLGLKEIDLFDSFFNVGGDSILAIKVIQQIEKQYGSIIDVTDIFTYPTISQLAEHIRAVTQPTDVPREIRESAEVDLDTLLSQLESGDISVEEANAQSIQ
ncbi:type I polyketide synthase [Photobacterium sp. TY1-4]|uniref:type I polyketide synthase n=1 Tax=Photobacterium sp. TY1-4 TaxID=2899122 RepID=UPI0021C0825B|nr:type I polyketide synthase [Photobacterium sp. TY1-4]UXI00910.1 SDR family NAD(P)-dependent oxidoreductase [Photobacterium sp. TY1-4]